MDKQIKTIIEEWGKTSIVELVHFLDMNIGDILDIAFEQKLNHIDTPNVKRRWSKEEEEFLVKNAGALTIREASNLLYRSYYATYQRVRLLGLKDAMIKRR